MLDWAHEAQKLLEGGRAPTPLLQHALLDKGVGPLGDSGQCAKGHLSGCVFRDAFADASHLPPCACAAPDPVRCRKVPLKPYADGQARRAVEDWRRFQAGEIKLLYLSPERLMTGRMLAALEPVAPALFVVDEAHCISAARAQETNPNPASLTLTANLTLARSNPSPSPSPALDH